jgi:hypothetical protein
MKDIFETCEDCYGPVNIIEFIVKDTPDGNCIIALTVSIVISVWTVRWKD